MNILILSAFPEEQTYYKNNLVITSTSKIGFIDVLHSNIQTANVYLATTGMGTTNAALVLATLVHDLKPDIIFFSGTSGGIDPKLRIGDVVIATDIFDADILSIHDAVIGTPFEGALINPNVKQKTPQIYAAHPSLNELAKSLKPYNHNVVHGRIATSNHFPSPAELFAQIKAHNALVIDMESSALYQFGWLTQLPILVVRGVSNVLDQQGHDDDVANSDISSSDNAARVVLDCIDASVQAILLNKVIAS